MVIGPPTVRIAPADSGQRLEPLHDPAPLRQGEEVHVDHLAREERGCVPGGPVVARHDPHQDMGPGFEEIPQLQIGPKGRTVPGTVVHRVVVDAEVSTQSQVTSQGHRCSARKGPFIVLIRPCRAGTAGHTGLVRDVSQDSVDPQPDVPSRVLKRFREPGVGADPPRPITSGEAGDVPIPLHDGDQVGALELEEIKGALELSGGHPERWMNAELEICVLKSVREIVLESGGSLVAVSETEIREARSMIEDLEGLSPCFSAAAAFAGVVRMARAEALPPDHTILVNLTGSDRQKAERAGSHQWMERTDRGWEVVPGDD